MLSALTQAAAVQVLLLFKNQNNTIQYLRHTFISFKEFMIQQLLKKKKKGWSLACLHFTITERCCVSTARGFIPLWMERAPR